MAHELGRIYGAVSQLMPMIVDHEGKDTMASVLLYDGGQVEKVRLGDYTMTVAFGHDRRPGGATPAPSPNVRRAGALFILTAPDEIYCIASNEIEVAVTLTPDIARAPAGRRWHNGRGQFCGWPLGSWAQLCGSPHKLQRRCLAAARRLSSYRRRQRAWYLARPVVPLSMRPARAGGVRGTSS